MTGNRRKPTRKDLILMVFESLMSVFYVFLAYILAFTETFGHLMDYPVRLVLGIILFLYGIYRVYRAVEKIILIRHSNED
jgi:hypothetical protein